MTVSGITTFGRQPDSEDVTAEAAEPAEAARAPRVEGFPSDYVALDLETTGFYPNSCAITEIGAVRVRDRRIVDRFQRLVNPLKPIPAQVVRLTGITDDMVSGLDPIDQVLPEFTAWLAQGADGADGGTDGGIAAIEPLIGHNIKFDLSFIDYNCRQVLGEPFSCLDYDTMQISRAMFPEQRRHRLLDLIQRFGIADNEEHRALSDAIQTQQCFEWMHKYADRHAGHSGFRGVDWKATPAKGNKAILHRQIVLY
ncbi:3'-5' exonuclease [Bifidobacterium sp. CP2]|uniref:3'-5' exonuclease n=1 Tax=Bifidobacterium sp. CP2 TaxID=2809025 RepID=UPI001BDDA5B2|nr:3'-5' exonuclease [Bifidobacterium sp. CP2]MBT1180607.1 3'-5' exonuclease [Bifidobacterium sp. CP2]